MIEADLLSFLGSALGFVFLYAGGVKILNRVSVRPFLQATGFSPGVSTLASRLTPFLECTVGATMLSGVFMLLGLVVATFLSIGFLAVLLLAHARGVKEGCQCFAALDSNQVSVWSVGRAAAVLAAALAGLLFRLAGTASSAAVLPHLVTMVLGIGTGIGFVLAFALLEQVSSFEEKRARPASLIR